MIILPNLIAMPAYLISSYYYDKLKQKQLEDLKGEDKDKSMVAARQIIEDKNYNRLHAFATSDETMLSITGANSFIPTLATAPWFNY